MIKKYLILLAALITSVIFVPRSYSQSNYNIKEMTPQVEDALESRRDRYDDLSTLKMQGIIGENNKGYVEVLKDNSEAKKLVSAENKDRKTIYKTIAEQNNVSDQIATIEKVFAQVQRDKAQAGEMIQAADGNWIKK